MSSYRPSKIQKVRLLYDQCCLKCAVAHNCHGKTKSHGKTNLTHGKTKLTHSKTKLTHGKTKKTSWSTVGQRLLFASEMVRRITVNKRNGEFT